MTTAWAQALSLIQNNCTFLNEMSSGAEFFEQKIAFDFCKSEDFTTRDLAFALRFINFAGYTGPIFFSNEMLELVEKPSYLYSVNSSLHEPEFVGLFTSEFYRINLSRISFVDDKIPISGKTC